jgi:hypothetical protein
VSEVNKVKLPDGTTVSVKAFSPGNNEDYILHWAVILCLFDQKGLKSDVEALANAAKDQMEVLETIHKSLGKKKTTSEAEQPELKRPSNWLLVQRPSFLRQ